MSQGNLSAQLEQLRNSLGGTGLGVPRQPTPAAPVAQQPQFGLGGSMDGVMGTQNAQYFPVPASNTTGFLKKYGKYVIVFALVSLGIFIFVIRKKFRQKSTQGSSKIPFQPNGPRPPMVGPSPPYSHPEMMHGQLRFPHSAPPVHRQLPPEGRPSGSAGPDAVAGAGAGANANDHDPNFTPL